ncbi:hypothetical protein C4D60_Mb04t23170 [Musa balbisiana]|uniref:Uncharacterized protein n=1 Tax=Musa balbisiana TaxID=52838 RepID=A0A4S8KE60_MUSBA|nr:hypothetical protein C4D60_Mb04t23170 [Musa balbisiana]
MAASSRGLAAPPFDLGVRRVRPPPPLTAPPRRRTSAWGRGVGRAGVRCCCPAEKAEEWWLEPKKQGGGGGARRTRAEALPSLPFPTPRSKRLFKQQDFSSRCSPRGPAPESRDTPPKRDTGIASEKEWGINLLDEKVSESGTNEDGSAEKSGRNAEGDSWWETWKEVLYQDEWRTDKWAETQLGTRWGDKWEEKFFAGIGSRQGETWHVSPTGERWSRTWGEEHFGNGGEPHYGWAEVVGDSTQLLSIQPQERPPGVYPNLDFGASEPQKDDPPDEPLQQ